MNACLRAARILLFVYTHHVTSKSRDVHIYARVVHFNNEKSVFVSAQPSRRMVLHKRGRGLCEKDQPLRRITETHQVQARGGEG